MADNNPIDSMNPGSDRSRPNPVGEYMGGVDEQVQLPDSERLRGENPSGFSEAEQISYLENKETNFVFLFGKRKIGKTVITASLLNYMSSHCDYGNLISIYDTTNERSNHGRILLETIRTQIARKRLPGRTVAGEITEIDVRFEPFNKSKPNLWLTFLEMSGEDLEKLDVSSLDPIPSNIDVFFKANNLSMTFILVTSHGKASEDDQIMAQFFDYIVGKDPKFKSARMLLLISQWDTFKYEVDFDTFLRQRMPLTFARMRHNSNAHRHFSIGEVTQVDGEDFLREYDVRPSEDVFFWLYRSLTRTDLKSWWERIKEKLSAY